MEIIPKTMMKIKILDDRAIVPVRAHRSDAGMDVFALEDVYIPPQYDYLFPLGWACEIPEGWVLIVKEKSGRAVKDKFDVGACVIDSGYRGEVHVHLFNNSASGYGFHPETGREIGGVEIKAGEKIAQMILVPCWTGDPVVVDELDETERGDGGFGSTGLKTCTDIADASEQYLEEIRKDWLEDAEREQFIDDDETPMGGPTKGL